VTPTDAVRGDDVKYEHSQIWTFTSGEVVTQTH
jgi:hypothetical protein